MAVKTFVILIFSVVAFFPTNILGQCGYVGCCQERNDFCNEGFCYCDDACVRFKDCCVDFFNFCKRDHVQVYPRSGTVLGGTSVLIFGLFSNLAGATCKFGDFPTTAARIHSAYNILCVSPRNFQGGRVSLVIEVSGSMLRTDFLYMTPDEIPDGVLRVHRNEWRFDPLIRFPIKWDESKIGSPVVDIELWSYSETASGQPVFSRVLKLATEETNDGDCRFGVPNMQGLYDIIDAGVIRVVEKLNITENRKPRSVWSDVHVVDYLTPINNAQTYCLSWLLREISMGLGFLDSRQACPCTLRSALISMSLFSPDPSCNQRSDDLFNCERKPEAMHCVRANFPSPDGGGQECCYNDNGRLLNIASSDGGGNAHRVHHKARVPFFSNFLSDIVPWIRCCKSQSGSARCFSYKELRPSQMCSGFRRRPETWTGGDPHFRSLDGLEFTFNGLGEFLYTDVDNGLFVAHIRTGRVSPDHAATMVTAVAAKHRDGDTFHMEVISPGETEIRIIPGIMTGNESFVVDFEVNSHWKADDLIVSEERDRKTGKPVTLVQFSEGIALRITEDQGMLDMRFIISEEFVNRPTKGLLGIWNENTKDDLTARDGVVHNNTDEEIHIFGNSWILSEDEALFYRKPNDTPPFSFPDFVPVAVLSNPNVSETDLSDVCKGNAFCEFDFLVTGNAAVGGATLNFVESFENDTIEMDKAGVTCPPLNDTLQLKVTVSGSMVGDNATYSCIDGYSLVGDATTFCNDTSIPEGDPFWSNPPPSCSLNTVPPVFACPNGWTYLDGKCYRIFSDGALSNESLNIAADYAGRKQVCQYFQGTLAVLEPFISNMYLWTQIISPGSGELFAIGLDDITTDGDFRWLDGTTPTQTSWSPGHPKFRGNDEDCVFVRANKQLQWEVLPCNSTAQFICQRHASRDSHVCGEIVSGSQPSVGYLLGSLHGSRRCVATLINSKWAVTSATCVWADRAVFGTDTYSENPLPPAQVREFVFFPHPEFDHETGRNDVAVLLLEEPVVFSSTVKPMCVDTSHANSNCSLTSWRSIQNVSVLKTNTFAEAPPSACAISVDPFAERDSGIKICMESQDDVPFVPCEQDTGAPFHCIDDVTGRQTLVAVNTKGFCNDGQLPRLEIGAKVITNPFIAEITEREFLDCSGNGIAFKSQICNYEVDCPAMDDEIGCPAPDAGTMVTINATNFGLDTTEFSHRTWLFRAQSSSINVTITELTLTPSNGYLVIGSGTDPWNLTSMVDNITTTGESFAITSEYVWVVYSMQSAETNDGFKATVLIDESY